VAPLLFIYYFEKSIISPQEYFLVESDSIFLMEEFDWLEEQERAAGLHEASSESESNILLFP
jgi:hypothetical protein